MKRSLTPAEKALVSIFRARIEITVEVIERLFDDYTSGDQIRAVVAGLADKGDFRGLRIAAREIEASTIGLTPSQRAILDRELKTRLGIDRNEEREQLRVHWQQVFASGKIASEKQRRHLEEYLEFLETLGDYEGAATAKAFLASH